MKEKARILVLDDDPDICAMLQLMLEYNDYHPMIAGNEEEARSILHHQATDLIIMDMLLSGLDGTDVCRRLKQESGTTLTPILMFSAHPNAREICLSAGADDFISKPFDMNELLEKISTSVQLKKAKQDH